MGGEPYLIVCGNRNRTDHDRPGTRPSQGGRRRSASLVDRSAAPLAATLISRARVLADPRMASRRHKGNPQLVHLLLELRRASKHGEVPIWGAAADRLKRARHGTSPLNVGHLERLAHAGETIAVPGKLLAAGPLSKKLTVGAVGFSGEAKAKIHAAGGTAVALADLVKAHPDGKGVRLLA